VSLAKIKLIMVVVGSMDSATLCRMTVEVMISFFRISVGFILTSLIAKISNPTKYPRIFCSNEPIPDRAFLQDHLQKLEETIQSDEFEKTKEILKILVPEYTIPSRFIPQTPPMSFPQDTLLN